MLRTLSTFPALALLITNAPALFDRLYRYEWYRSPLNDWLDALKVGENAKMLELGCGPGNFARDIASKGIDVTAMDRSSKMIKKAASRKGAVEFLVGDATQTGLGVGQFDYVLSASLINVVPDSKHLLTEVARVLRPGGMASVLFPTPEFDGAHAERIIADYGCGFFAAGALRLWASKARKLDPQEVCDSFEDCGFAPSSVSSFLDGGLAAVTGKNKSA
ncbi:class I SAM-dependent methyltransferase [Profundibacter sp.]|uniref:class I SAM-dependent methyltransferase n=1 Tax=Profundibacter sp. TaxID=3101071 RepID=UPI003D0A0266